jgi:hypothetical protein
MSWNIKTPGDYINGPLTVAGSATITGAATVGTTLGVTGVATFAAGTVSLPALTTTGDTNTGIYYPAADTFAVTTGGTQRILVNSTGLNVGAGVQYAKITTSAGSNVTGIANIENSAFASNANSNLSCYIGHDGTNNRPFIQAATGNAGSAFSLLINPYGGDVSIGNGNVVMATSGKGIDFSATTSGSGTMTSELLNDYEEGTWVGTLTGGTTNPTVPVTATGRYTKIGRVVTVQISFSNVNTVGASGSIGVTGLPFACNNSASSSNGSVSFYSIATFTGSPFTSIGVNESFLNFFSNISNAAFGNVTHNAGAAGNYLTASITYTV